jgi:acyl-homoserine lactone acylase PvdQ
MLVLLLLPLKMFAQPLTTDEINRCEQQSKKITIIRDNWGIPHIYGKTDADAVFGLLYAQCEDDFKRVEMNYIEKLGRMSEVKGEASLQSDLYIRLIIDSAEAVADYNKSPDWLKKLLNAYADGINYYLYKHPETKPVLLNRFQPWYPLLWTDGSIGAISTGNVTEEEVRKIYLPVAAPSAAVPKPEEERTTGSNGFALSPYKTQNSNAILYINPHVTFYFRPEVHMVSEEGLNVYGAVTWGQFFIYQGFNEYCGWMHTSSNVDVSDMYAEKISYNNGRLYYQYNKKVKPVITKKINLGVLKNNSIAQQEVTAFYTPHGPLMAKRGEQWITVKSNNRSLNGLIQSWQRTKAKGFAEFKNIMGLRGNTSNNTVFADNRGHIAYWHGNFVPKRNKNINWGKVVDGTTSATEWNGLHTLDEIVHAYDPKTGFIQNCNSTPFTCSDTSSPKKENYPAYMAPDGENFRGINAARLLSSQNNFTLEKIIATGYDTKLSAFEILIPALLSAFEKNVKPGDSMYYQLYLPVNVLKNWNYRCSEYSTATTIAIEWAQKLNSAIQKVYIEQDEADQVQQTKQFVATATANDLLLPFYSTINELNNKFGSWQMPWGRINRFQRISGDINQHYNDDKESYPVAFASSTWGMLPAYNSRYYPDTKKRYGVSGNSFVCAVEFGKKIKAKSLLAGGQSGDSNSKHFTDQLEMYTKGTFKDVLFYKEDVLQHAEKTYHPGE